MYFYKRVVFFLIFAVHIYKKTKIGIIMKGKRLVWLLMLMLGLGMTASAQRIALKTNMLYWAAMTPNIELEARMAPKVTADITLAGSLASAGGYKLNFAGVEPEVRFWTDRPMARHFFGVAGMFVNYHMKMKEKKHYGDAVGAGLVYGYAFVLGKRWNLETSVGVGMAHFREKRFETDEPDKANHSGWAVVPMRVGITLAYILK